MSQQSTLKLAIQSLLSGTSDLAVVSSQIDYQVNQQLQDGTGANQANQVWSDTRTLSSNTSETLDLNASLTNDLGASVTFTKVKAIFIRNKGSTTLSIGGAASNQFVNWVADATDIVKVPPGGLFLLTAPDASGFGVTAGTGDSLKIANAAGASCDYDIVLVGVN